MMKFILFVSTVWLTIHLCKNPMKGGLSCHLKSLSTPHYVKPHVMILSAKKSSVMGMEVVSYTLNTHFWQVWEWGVPFA
jgi:hypothetical protein